MQVTLFEGCKEGGETIRRGVFAVVVTELNFKITFDVLIDFSISCCRLGSGGGLLEDGTGIPLNGVGVVAVKGSRLNNMVGSENAR
jgi:hypothetical protein